MRFHFTLLLLSLSLFVSATDYYIKNGGNDLASGTSDAAAWATIGKVNAAFPSMKPGDRILFQRGNTFYGSILISKSGTAGNPITIGAYGTGEKPVITGFTAVTAWTNEGNGIYSTSLTSEAQSNMVTINGVQYAMGRWPDLTYNIFETFETNVSITDADLGATIDWTGAEVAIRKNDYTIDRCRITDHTGNKLVYKNLGTTQNSIANYGYFIQNDIKCLSAFGEWFHDTGSGKFYMYFGSVDPSSRNVRVATLNTMLLNNGSDYIVVDNLTFTGSISHAITYLTYASNYCTVRNSVISFAGLDGIHFLGEYGSIDNNTISECNQTGINLGGIDGTLTSNTIKNIGLVPGQAYMGSLTTGILIGNNGCLIQYNTIENVGYCGIGVASSSDILTIKNNYLNNILLVLNDGGGIYTTSDGSSRKIDGNIIRNVKGNTDGTPYPSRFIARGIYLDSFSTNVIVTNNTVFNCSEGGYMLHKAHDNKLENNTSFNNGIGIYFQNSAGSNIRNNLINNNIFFAKAPSQLALKFYSVADDILSFGTANNNYYARPADDNEVFQTYSPSTGSKNRTLAGWQSFTNQDLNSHKSPVSLTDTSRIDFFYNASKTNRVITLSQPMIDVAGTKYSGTVTLLPYTSVILMPDPNPTTTQPASPPIYSGSVIENTAPSVIVITFSLNLANVLPASTAFTIKVNGTNRAVSAVSISVNKVILTLITPVVFGDIITVSYTKPPSSPLQSAAGAQVESLTAQSVKNNITAPVNLPPVVIISSPSKGDKYNSPANITVDVEASDPDGTVTKVELFNGTIKMGELTTAPYSFTLKNLPEGAYALKAVATDNLKAVTTSNILDLHVTTYNENREFFNLYPNPNDGRFSINFTSSFVSERYTVTVFNIIGKTVYKEEIPKDDVSRQFDLSHLNPGIYVVMISDDKIITTQKFIKG